ncbi:MAG: hypothetical protein MUO81_07215 [Thermoplasmata archaeon]|nr:hypothetical protein [Thermoplasmata archaeon]
MIALAMSATVWFAYSAIVGVTIMGTLTVLLNSVFFPTSSAAGFKGYYVYWDVRAIVTVILSAIVGISMVLISLVSVLKHESRLRTWDKTVIAWGGLLFAFVFAFSKIFKSSSTPNYSRLLAFPWIFVLYSGLEKTVQKNKRVAFSTACVVFCVFNFLSINPYIYMDNYDLGRGEQYLMNSQMVFDSMTNLPIEGDVVCDASIAQVVNGWLLLNVGILPSQTNLSTDMSTSGSFVALHTSDGYMERLILDCGSNKSFGLVSDSGSLLVFTVAQTT